MKQGDPFTETGDELGFQLGGQGDFRHQHQHAPGLAERRRRGPQVDLGLAAAGNPVKKKRGKPLFPNRGQQLFQGRGLLRGQMLGRLGDRQAIAHGVAIHRFLMESHQPLGRQSLQGPAGTGVK